MKNKVNSSAVKKGPEELFIEEASRALEMKGTNQVMWDCSGGVFVWINEDGEVITESKILPKERVRFIENILNEAFIRRKLINACRKAGLKVALVNCNRIKVFRASAQ